MQVQDCRHHALAAQPIEQPTQHQVELPLMGVSEHGRKLRPFVCALPAAGGIDVLAHDLMPGTGAPVLKLPELVLQVLAFIISRPSHRSLCALLVSPACLKRGPLQDTERERS